MKKYPSITRLGEDENTPLFGHPVTVVEKMDGANFRFTHGKNVDGCDDDRLVFGSRNVIYKNEKDTDSAFEHAIEYVRDHIDPDDWVGEVESETGDSVTLFGEAMHPHTLEYDWDNVPNVLLFDGYSESYGWFSTSDIKVVSRRTGINHVPIIEQQAEFDDINSVPIPNTSEYNDTHPEGVVVRRGSGDSITRAKYRTDEFLNKHGSASRGQETVTDDSVTLAYDLLKKDNWVLKEIHRRENRGESVSMSDMESLWRAVFDDIIDECYEDVFLGNHDINTKKFRSTIASHVAEEVQAYIRRPDDSVLNET